MTLTKAHLIDRVQAANPNLSKTRARETVEAVLHILKNSLENGNDVLLSGFGKFNVRDKSARRGRNPQTGEPVRLAARKVVTFKPSKNLRDRVNGR